MDLGSTITALVIVLICIIPFIIMNINNRKKEQQFFKGLSDLAKKSNCTITRHDIWNSAAIGIDQENGVIFFGEKSKDSQALKQVILSEVQDCRLITTGTQSRDDHYEVIDKLELTFNYHDKNKKETLLAFYDASAAMPNLSGELQLANDWVRIVNDKIAALPQKKK